MRLVVIGDIHVYQLCVGPWRLLGKRAIGQFNLWVNRRNKFDLSLIEPTVQRVIALAPDVVLFSGDLTTTSLPGEFVEAHRRLEPLLSKYDCVVLPGNHDRYTFGSVRRRAFERIFGGHFGGPCMRSLTSRWRLIVVDSAVPRMGSSRGLIGEKQLMQVQAWLNELTEADGVIVMSHYPALEAGRWSHDLENAAKLAAMLKQCVAARVVYLHGHIHTPWVRRVSDRLIDVNAGSPTRVGGRWPRGQGVMQFDLADDSATDVTITHHQPKPDGHSLQWTTQAL